MRRSDLQFLIGGFVPSFVLSSRSRRTFIRIARSFCALSAVFALCISISAQASRPLSNNPSVNAPAKTEVQIEMERRLDIARAADLSGDPTQIRKANELVIAYALRQLGQLRLLESAFPQAVQLYRRSLNFEDIPATHIDLSVALIGAEKPDEAIAEAQLVLLAHPDNLRGLTVLGRAWMLKKEYRNAVEPLSRLASLSPSLENLYSLAVCLLAARDPEDKRRAAEVFQQMSHLAGDNGSLHVMFGRAFRDSGDMSAALTEFQRAIAIDPRTPHAHYFLGLARLSMNEWAPTPESRSEFVKELQYYPNDYLANYMIGFLDSMSRNYAEANTHLQLASRLNPAAPEPWLYLGLNSYDQGDMKFAESNLREAVALTGSDESRNNYQIRRAYIDLGRILMTSSRKEEGERYLAKARELQNKVFKMSQQQIGALLLEGGAGAAAVVQPLSEQAEKDAEAPSNLPSNPFAQVDASTLSHSNLTEEQKHWARQDERTLRSVLAQSFSGLATSEAMAQVYRSALGHYQEAERWDPHTPGLYRNLGVAAFRAGDMTEAIRALPLALEERLSDAPIRAMLGMAYYGANRFADAVNTFTPLGEAGMRDPIAGYAWAASLTKLGDLKPASQVLTEVEKNNLPPDTLLLVGQLWISIQDYARAVDTFERALTLNPALPRAHYYEGIAYLRWERHTEAAAEFEAELKLNPEDAEAKDNLGFLYLERSRRSDAEALFRSVLDFHPDDATAHYQLGKIFLEDGKLDEAISNLEQAARLNPDADYIHYQLQAAYRKASRIEDADRELEIFKEIKARKRASAVPSGMGDNP